MRISFLTENTHCGGMDSFLVTLINNWPEDSDKLTLICNQNHPGLLVIKERLTRPCSIVRHRLPVYSDMITDKTSIWVTNVVSRLVFFFFRYFLFMSYMFTLPKVLFGNNPDRLMVVAGGYPGGDTCRAAVVIWGIFKKKPRAIFNFHNLAMRPTWYAKCFEYTIDYMVGYFSKQLVTVSKAVVYSMSRRPVIAKMRKTSYIYNGIDCSNNFFESSPHSLKKELDVSSSSKICLMLGTYEPRKGHDFLLQAFQKVIDTEPSAHLVICGYGRDVEFETVRNLVERFDLKEHVHLFGFRNDITYLLKDTDILVVASQDYESFGLTCVEAMAHKVPVVATRVGGLPEVVVDDEGGYCVEPDDVEGYACKILALLNDETLRKKQGEKGFLHYQKMFTGERMANDYKCLIYDSN